MQGKHLFEYAIIRIVPRVEREEFLNVGVIIYCADQNYLNMKFELNKERLFIFSNDIDIEELEKRLFAFKQICKGADEGELLASFRSLPVFAG